MNAKQLPAKKPLNPVLFAGMALALVAVVGAVWWLFFSEPPQPWRVRARVVSYLKKQSRQDDFKIEFRFPSKEAMSRAPASSAAGGPGVPTVGELTKKNFDALSDEYLNLKMQAIVLEREAAMKQQELTQTQARLAAPGATASNMVAALQGAAVGLQKEVSARQQALVAKEQQMAPLLSDLWAFQRAWLAREEIASAAGMDELASAQAELLRSLRPRFDEAQTYGEMYAMIGQQLWVANRLFTSANPDHGRVALSLARQAAWDASRYTENPWLAARIYQGYIIPHLELADANDRRATLSLENLIGECTRLFRDLDEKDSILRLHKVLLAEATTPQRKDWARWQLAQVYEQEGEYARALRYLKQIERTNDFTWALRRVPWLQERLKTKR
jgi:hypothetical protein